MATSNGGFLHSDQPAPPPTLLPPWLSSSNGVVQPPSPSVALTLSPSTATTGPAIPWLQPERGGKNNPIHLGSLPSHGAIPATGNSLMISELLESCRELEKGHHAWAAHKKETTWRLKRVELQLQSEKACRWREKMEEIELKVSALREEQKATLERIEVEYKEQLAGLRRDAEAKEQKLAEQWAAKHLRLMNFLEQIGFMSRPADPNGR
ncbi:hypothetical protein NE237_003020 [Protea cynaroides]|uniref:Transcription factor AS1 n=1 Tax=Protea cynaroides TaxID=273540 RepID=A0A9Q0KGL3_9MAGN|nr:hypothetical protein NE237_003020 [Protea cynaroides]